MVLLFSAVAPGERAGALVPVDRCLSPVPMSLPAGVVASMSVSGGAAAVGVLQLTALLARTRPASGPVRPGDGGALASIVWASSTAGADRPVRGCDAAPVFLTGILLAFGADASGWDTSVMPLVVDVVSWLDDASFDRVLPVGLLCLDGWHVDAVPCVRLRARLDRLAGGSSSRRQELLALLAGWHGSFDEFASAARLLEI